MKYKKNDPSVPEVIGFCLLVIVFITAYIAALGWVFQQLWNLVVPSVFGGPTLQYQEALAIVAILFIISSFFGDTSKS